MGITTGIILYPGMEELDFVGPLEVFGMAGQNKEENRVVTIAEHDRVRAWNGLTVVPDHTFDDAPPLDVMVVPGGFGSREQVNNAKLIDYLRSAAANCQWVTSVCTGTLLLHEAGVAKGKNVTTHWSFIEGLRERGNVTVKENIRYVRDGNLVTAAGVSAGIDMSLWVVGQLYGAVHARQVQRFMEYYPAPPYQADV